MFSPDEINGYKRPNHAALLSQLGDPTGPPPPMPVKTGAIGDGSRPQRNPHAPDLPPQASPVAGSVPGLTAPADPSPTAPVAAPAGDWRGFLQDKTRGYQSTLQGIGDEAERERAVEDFLRGLMPELQQRGMTGISGVKKEKLLRDDGGVIDLYRDITNGRGTGAAEAQWLEEGPGGGDAGPAPDRLAGLMGGLSPQLAGDPLAGIQGEIAAQGKGSNIQALLAQLGLEDLPMQSGSRGVENV